MTTQFSPHTILVVVKPNHAPAQRLADEMHHWLTEQGLQVDVVTGGGAKADLSPYKADLAVVLGGDGTLLGVARAFVGAPIPLLGLNFGKVGFLAELTAHEWQPGLTQVLSGQCRIRKSMALGWRVLRAGAVVESGHAVNDVVISRGALSRVITLDVSTVCVHGDEAEEQHICLVRADGLIISSPLGSSGYAVSAGGPLVSPELNTLTIMPICPYLCNFPPIVMPHSYTLRALVQPGSVETFLTLDGQEGVTLQNDDVIEVFGLQESVHFARLAGGVYFKRLKGRGFIEEHSGVASQNC